VVSIELDANERVLSFFLRFCVKDLGWDVRLVHYLHPEYTALMRNTCDMGSNQGKVGKKSF
jgi:hypothetical protein